MTSHLRAAAEGAAKLVWEESAEAGVQSADAGGDVEAVGVPAWGAWLLGVVGVALLAAFAAFLCGDDGEEDDEEELVRAVVMAGALCGNVAMPSLVACHLPQRRGCQRPRPAHPSRLTLVARCPRTTALEHQPGSRSVPSATARPRATWTRTRSSSTATTAGMNGRMTVRRDVAAAPQPWMPRPTLAPTNACACVRCVGAIFGAAAQSKVTACHGHAA